MKPQPVSSSSEPHLSIDSESLPHNHQQNVRTTPPATPTFPTCRCSRHPSRVRHRLLPKSIVTALLMIWICGISHSTALRVGDRQREDDSNNMSRSSLFNVMEDTRHSKNDSQLRGPMIANSAQIRHYKATSIESESNINIRRMQLGRQGDPVQDGGNGSGVDNNEEENDIENPSNSAAAAGGNNAYGDYNTYMNSGSSTSYGNPGSISSNAGTAAAETTNTAIGGSSSAAYGSYGGSAASASTSASTGGYDASSSYGGGSSSYGADSSSSYGAGSSSFGAGSSSYGNDSSSYGNDSYSSAWGTGAASSSASSSPFKSSSSSFTSQFHAPSVNIFPVIFVLFVITLFGMMVTAHQMEHHPEGTFANCCRVSLHTVNCIYKVIYNLYHCRLGDIPQVVFASEFEEDEYTDEEIERMRLRPGIERALDVEHRKALRKVGIEMNKIKVTKKKGSVQSAGSIQR